MSFDLPSQPGLGLKAKGLTPKKGILIHLSLTYQDLIFIGNRANASDGVFLL